MQKFYFRLDDNGTIVDAIDYDNGTYQEFEAEFLPPGISGGWFSLIDGVIVKDESKDPEAIENKLQEAIDEYTMTLIQGGLL